MNFLRRNWIAVGFVAIGTLFLCDAYAYDPRDMLPYIINHKVSCRAVVQGKPRDKQKEEYLRQYHFHQIHGETAFMEAEDLCRWISNDPVLEIISNCFTQAKNALANHKPSKRHVDLVYNLVLKQGVENCDEWEEIQTKLEWAEYHFELADHYQNLLGDK